VTTGGDETPRQAAHSAWRGRLIPGVREWSESMKAKKTIRKMAHRPLARELAKLQRSVRTIEKRLTRLVEFADEIETEGRTLRRESAELRGRLALAEAPPGDDVPLFAEEAEGPQIPAFNSPTRPPEIQAEIDNNQTKLCLCGHLGAEHGTRGKYCCRVNCSCEGFREWVDPQ